MRNEPGFSLVEAVIAMALSLIVLLGLYAAYAHGTEVKMRVQGSVKIESNVRLAMDRMSRDLRVAGFAVPEGTEIGGTASWRPVIFHASATEIGYRADADGGSAGVVCTPTSTNTDCPLDKLRLDSIRYYQDLNCAAPDGASGGLKVVVSVERDDWEPARCTGYSTGDGSISVTTLTDATFTAGDSKVATIEQVYYRYAPGSRQPYGSLQRFVVYGNAPNDSFPPTGASWTTVADHLTDFWLEYQDETGATLVGSPLSVANRAAVRKIVLFMEGYDQIGPRGQPQVIQVRSEILLRNPA
jgi:hypothetical protein